MKLSKLFSLLVPLIAGTAAALWTPLQFWFDVKEGLIAFLGFLAASLVQVMPLTANFLQSDRLTPAEAERLTASLTRQQRYWMGLLFATIGAMVVVIVGAALKDRVLGIVLSYQDVSIEVSAIVCFVMAACVTFVLLKMLGLFEGMMSLHHLRGELVLSAARREASDKAAAMQKEAMPVAPIVSPDYGRVLHPH